MYTFYVRNKHGETYMHSTIYSSQQQAETNAKSISESPYVESTTIVYLDQRTTYSAPKQQYRLTMMIHLEITPAYTSRRYSRRGDPIPTINY